jgi:hypothetical protein
LSMFFTEALESAHISELSSEFSVQLEKVKEKSSVLLEGKQWSRVDGVLYFEDRRCVPEARVFSLMVWLHENHGHPQISRLLPLFRRQFYTKLTDVKLKEIYSRHKCVCAKAKQNSPSDRGLLRSLPIPYMANSVLYVDFIDGMPKYNGYILLWWLLVAFQDLHKHGPSARRLMESKSYNSWWKIGSCHLAVQKKFILTMTFVLSPLLVFGEVSWASVGLSNHEHSLWETEKPLV